jgi:putative aldouronate transport system substrate-binding protein
LSQSGIFPRPGKGYRIGAKTDTASGSAFNIYDQYKAFNDSADRSAAFGFSFDSTSVKNELAALTNISDQYIGAINTGALDPDNIIPKFLEDQKAAGMEKVIAAKQTQLDAFVAAKK